MTAYLAVVAIVLASCSSSVPMAAETLSPLPSQPAADQLPATEPAAAPAAVAEDEDGVEPPSPVTEPMLDFDRHLNFKVLVDTEGTPTDVSLEPLPGPPRAGATDEIRVTLLDTEGAEISTATGFLTVDSDGTALAEADVALPVSEVRARIELGDVIIADHLIAAVAPLGDTMIYATMYVEPDDPTELVEFAIDPYRSELWPSAPEVVFADSSATWFDAAPEGSLVIGGPHQRRPTSINFVEGEPGHPAAGAQVVFEVYDDLGNTIGQAHGTVACWAQMGVSVRRGCLAMSSLVVPVGADSIGALVAGAQIAQVTTGQGAPTLLIEGDTWQAIDDHGETTVQHRMQGQRGDTWVNLGAAWLDAANLQRWLDGNYLTIGVDGDVLVARPGRDAHFDTDAFRLLISDGLHITAIELAASTTAVAVTMDLADFGGFDGDLCDVIWSADFAGEGVYARFAGSEFEFSYEDIADGFQEAVCTANVISEVGSDSDDRDSFELHADPIGRVLLSGTGDTSFLEDLEMTGAVSWAERTSLPELSLDQDAARAVGLAAVDTILALDRSALAELMAEEIVILEDEEVISRAEFAQRPPLERGTWNRSAPGRAPLADGRLGRIDDYLANYDVEIRDVDVERWPALETLADGRAMYLFSGWRVRADGQGFLFDDLLSFVLVQADDDWQILAVQN